MRDDAFLRAIGEDPADDAPRLVFADWLDEHGDVSRAEFIRIQCELARPGGDRGRRTDLQSRERELLKVHESAWARPFRPGCDGWEFRRGFVEMIATDANRLADLSPALFAPGIVREVRVTGPLRPALLVHGTSHLNAVRTLRVCSLAFRTTDLWMLREAEALADLDVLDLRWNDLTPAHPDPITGVAYLPGRTILLGGNHFGPDDRTGLAEVLGDRVSFAVGRPADHLYRVGQDANRLTGIDADHRQIIVTYAGRSPPRLLAFCFDLDGELIAVEEYAKPTRPRFLLVDDPVARLFASRLGFVPGWVTVRKFRHAETGVGIADFTDEHRDLIDDPPPHPDPADVLDAIRADAYRRLKYEWVPNGDFVFGEGFP